MSKYYPYFSEEDIKDSDISIKLKGLCRLFDRDTEYLGVLPAYGSHLFSAKLEDDITLGIHPRGSDPVRFIFIHNYPQEDLRESKGYLEVQTPDAIFRIYEPKTESTHVKPTEKSDFSTDAYKNKVPRL